MPTREALAAHLQADPSGLGYAALIEAGAVEALWRRLHEPVPGAEVAVAELSAAALTAALDLGEVKVLSAESLRLLDFLLARPALAVTPSLLTELLALFPAGTATRDAIAPLLTRDGSALELAFGAGVQVSERDVVKALQTFDHVRYPAELAPPDAEGRELKVEVDGALVPATKEHLADERIALKVVEPARHDRDGILIEEAKVLPVQRGKTIEAEEVIRGNR